MRGSARRLAAFRATRAGFQPRVVRRQFGVVGRVFAFFVPDGSRAAGHDAAFAVTLPRLGDFGAMVLLRGGTLVRARPTLMVKVVGTDEAAETVVEATVVVERGSALERGMGSEALGRTVTIWIDWAGRSRDRLRSIGTPGRTWLAPQLPVGCAVTPPSVGADVLASDAPVSVIAEAPAARHGELHGQRRRGVRHSGIDEDEFQHPIGGLKPGDRHASRQPLRADRDRIGPDELGEEAQCEPLRVGCEIPVVGVGGGRRAQGAVTDAARWRVMEVTPENPAGH